MNPILNKATTFTASFGISATGKTVTITVLDENGNVTGSGYTAGSVVELSDGTYGVKITFSSEFSGYLRFNNTTDSTEVYVPFVVLSDFPDDTERILKIEKNRWKIDSNQLIIYDNDGTTALYTFNLLKASVANGDEPDERVPV